MRMREIEETIEESHSHILEIYNSLTVYNAEEAWRHNLQKQQVQVEILKKSSVRAGRSNNDQVVWFTDLVNVEMDGWDKVTIESIRVNIKEVPY